MILRHLGLDESRRSRLKARALPKRAFAWRRLLVQCHLVFPNSSICLWGRPLACAGRLARLFANSARSGERGWEPRADEACAPPKLQDPADIGVLDRPEVAIRIILWPALDLAAL